MADEEMGEETVQESFQSSGLESSGQNVLLCLHGHPGNGACMTVFTERLSRRFRTVAPDLRGYGRNRVRDRFVMTDHLEDLERLLEESQVGEVWILGWSLGGILALELALRWPGRVRGLILVATAARPWGDHPRTGWWEDGLTAIASLLNWFRPGWRWNIETFGKRSLYRYLVQHHTPSTYRYLARYALPAYLQTSRQAQQALFAALGTGYNRAGDLGRIPCPVLVLAGEGDRHITAAASQETARRLPQATYRCYTGVAHLFPWEIPEQVLGDIEAWLDQMDSTQINSTGQTPT